MWQLTLMAWLYWLGVIGALAGGVVLVRRCWARRLDDHPICRRCGYDLFGIGADRRDCPECGASLAPPRAIRIGHRTRHKPMIAWGLLLALLFGGGAYLADWRHEVVRFRPGAFFSGRGDRQPDRG